MSLLENYPLVWFIIGILFLFAELIMPGFIIFFFGIGALVTALLTLLFGIENVAVQILIFLVASVLSLVFLRNFFSKMFKGKIDAKGNVGDEFIGRKVMVVREIQPNSLKGKVELNGALWEADSEFYIKKDAVVEIIDRKDLTLIVKPIE
jgi:inner membrane protein